MATTAIVPVGRERTSAGRLRAAYGFAAVVVVALFLLFHRLGEPRQPIWDEAYYLPTTARYHEARAQFAAHPPLGLMLIAAGDRLTGGNADIDQRVLAGVKSIRGEDMPAGYDYFGPRAASALFGAIGAGLFFLLMLELTGSAGASAMLSTLYLCDPALIAQFRAAHLDAFQLAFALAAIICALRAVRGGHWTWALGFGAAATAATLVRANGVMLLAMAPCMLWPLLSTGSWRRAALRTGAVICGGAAAIGMVAAAYGALSRQLPDTATVAGAQDIAFVSSAHRAAIATGHWTPSAITTAFGDHVRFIGSDLEGMTRSDPNGSHPYEWLIGQGAVTYRWDSAEGRVSALGLVPNFAGWALSLLGVALAIRSLLRRPDALHALLPSCWLAAMGALVWLDQLRVLYVYHYFIPLLAGHAMLGLAWREAGLPNWPARLAMPAVAACFALAAPLALHQDSGRWRCALLLPECGPTG